MSATELRTADLRVLYEDNHLIGVYKPAGVLTQGDQSGEPCLLDWVKQWLVERYQKPGNVFLGLLHRLDRPVSGVVLFAKTSKAASRLSQQFRERSVEKTYQARLEGVIRPERGKLQHFLTHTEGVRRVRVDRTAGAAAKSAALHYQTLWSGMGACIVAVQLETGRKHQIRAQFSAVGHPLVGDALYGSHRPLAHDTIALCAVQLTFAQPVSAEPISVHLPAELLPEWLRIP